MAAKSVEEIKAEVTALVKSQGNQGAISLGTVLDDITELAGEGGGGGSTPNVIQISSADGVDWTIDNPDDLEGLAAKAEQGELVMIKTLLPLGGQTVTTIAPAKYDNMGAQKILRYDTITVSADAVSSMSIVIDVVQKAVRVQTNVYPA